MALGKRLINTGGAAACNTDSTDPFGDSSGVALYNLDYDASDASGTYDGSPSNVDFGVEGKINYGARFNGSSSDIDLPSGVNSTTMSVSFWMYIDSIVSGNEVVIEFANGYGVWFLSSASGKLGMQSSNGNSSHTLSDSQLSAGSWHHIVAVWNSGSRTFYIDKQVQSGGSVTDYLTCDQNTIGSRRTGEFFDGKIDQVRIFSKALDETTNGEVSALYAETACVYTATTTDNDYPTTNLAYYKLDNSAEDEKGSYDGTESNIEYRFGRFGQAAVFNGSSSIFDTNLSVPTNWTVSLWLKRTPSGYFGGTTNASVRSGVYFYSGSNGSLLVYNRDSGGGNIDTLTTATGLISEGNWHHVSITFDSTSGTGLTTVYIDGASVGTLDGTPTHSTDFKFGRSGDYTSEYFNGSIDQVRIYDAALTPSQVTDLYNEKPEVDTSNFKAVLYTGNGSSQYISNVGFEPDLVWIKARETANSHGLYDSVRGAGNLLSSDKTDQNFYYTTVLNSFDSNGFTVGTSSIVNTNGDDYVGWCWKGGGEAVNIGVNSITASTPSRASDVSANTEAGFSIVTLDKPNTNTDTYGHGLTSAPPELIILKRTASADDWYVYTKELGNTVRLSLNSSAEKVTGTGVWGSTTPTSSVFTLQNQLGGAHVAYCFHSVAGYSKIGSYNGTSSTGNRIYVDSNNDGTGTGGFEPSFVMLKRTNGTGNWFIYDNKRPNTNYLRPDLSNAKGTDGGVVFTSDGFTINVTYNDHNTSGGTYLYMAFK